MLVPAHAQGLVCVLYVFFLFLLAERPWNSNGSLGFFVYEPRLAIAMSMGQVNNLLTGSTMGTWCLGETGELDTSLVGCRGVLLWNWGGAALGGSPDGASNVVVSYQTAELCLCFCLFHSLQLQSQKRPKREGEKEKLKIFPIYLSGEPLQKDERNEKVFFIFYCCLKNFKNLRKIQDVFKQEARKRVSFLLVSQAGEAEHIAAGCERQVKVSV